MIPLPGLDRLVSVCEDLSLPLRLDPPLASAPAPGASILGQPLDDQLAAVYQRFGGGELGPLLLYRPGSDWVDLIPWNERLRQLHTLHYRSSLIFGEKTGFPLYFATVPQLADAQGLQPVVYIDGHEVQYAVPIASSVDRFFDAYSRYLELMAVDPEYVHPGTPTRHFPWDVPHLFTRDEPLIAQIRADRFNFLTNEVQEASEWLRQLLTTSR